jgi:hypothetical protein
MSIAELSYPLAAWHLFAISKAFVGWMELTNAEVPS